MSSTSEPRKYDADDHRRIACVPAFAGLRRFPEGRGFKQWTGDDSRALMKVCGAIILSDTTRRSLTWRFGVIGVFGCARRAYTRWYGEMSSISY